MLNFLKFLYCFCKITVKQLKYPRNQAEILQKFVHRFYSILHLQLTQKTLQLQYIDIFFYHTQDIERFMLKLAHNITTLLQIFKKL